MTRIPSKIILISFIKNITCLNINFWNIYFNIIYFIFKTIKMIFLYFTKVTIFILTKYILMLVIYIYIYVCIYKGILVKIDVILAYFLLQGRSTTHSFYFRVGKYSFKTEKGHVIWASLREKSEYTLYFVGEAM